MRARGDVHRNCRICGEGIGGEAQASPICLCRAQIHAHVQRAGPGIDPQRMDEHRLLGAQAYLAQQAVPVGLGLVRGRRGVDDIRPGQAWIAVVRQQYELGPRTDAPRHLEDLSRAQRGWFKRGHLLPIYEQPQAAGALHIDKCPHVLRKLKIQGSAQSGLALKADPAGQPRGDGAFRACHTGIPVADAGLIQRSGNADVPREPVNRRPPDTRQ